MNILMYLDFLLLYLLVFFQLHTIKVNNAGSEKDDLNQRYPAWLDPFIKVSIMFFCWLLHLPVILLYIFLYISYALTYLDLYKRSKATFYFWVNSSFIGLASLHLICLSGVTLMTGKSLGETVQNQGAWLFAMTLTWGLLDFTEWFLVKKKLLEKTSLLFSDTARFRQFIHFEYYAVAYLLFDSIPCMYQLPYGMLSVFLMGSCILLLFQVLLFMVYTLRIIEKAHYEAEYYRLQEERSNEIKKEMELQKLAYNDSLTGTFTRRYAMEMLDSFQKDHRCVTVAYIDVNGLKKVNDTLGHPVGDDYLVAIANYLNEGLHKNDVLARIGGDEFLIVSSGRRKQYLEGQLNQINIRLSSIKIDGFTPSFSFGVAETKEDSAFNIEELIKESDSLMYSYKTEFKRGERRT